LVLVQTLTAEYLVESDYEHDGEGKVPTLEHRAMFGVNGGEYVTLRNPIQVRVDWKNGSILLVGNPYIHIQCIRTDCIVGVGEAPREVFANVDKYREMMQKKVVGKESVGKVDGFALPTQLVGLPGLSKQDQL
jgi:hypothetical protein